jgi:hypothetical protein
VMPIVSAPLAAARAATTDESTPPDIATTMRQSAAARGRSNSAAACCGSSELAGAVERNGNAFTAARPYTGLAAEARRHAGEVLITGKWALYRFLTGGG